jgi:F0F1-type ATP synthase assembly protein I
MKLFINRDNYDSIHFHLDHNTGGDLVPVHLILRCLVGNKENWMCNIKKKLYNKKILEWDCWNEEDTKSPNYNKVKYLNLDFIPKYLTKYNGKIHLYIHNYNGSAVWFLITYLIYGFCANIKRFSKIYYGQKIKFGKCQNSQLIIHGTSSTTSGDGNSITVKYNNINVNCPTEQFIDCSVKYYDWNRFWIE